MIQYRIKCLWCATKLTVSLSYHTELEIKKN